ncbi:transferase family-domain-containing protein [Diaporthe sp. PMI_573]|nr:transferase family-domain-containing protein [Diaporthaceae sp. PMI_573]
MGEPVAIPLSPMDNVMPRFYINFILTFRLKSAHDFGPVHEVLQKSLEKTCKELPVFRSRVFTIPPDSISPSTGRLAARTYENWSPEVVYNDISDTWSTYEDLMEDGLHQDLLDGKVLLPKSRLDSDFTSTGAPALITQANYVKLGLLLAVSIFHPTIDGMSASLLMKLWASNARAIQGCGKLGPPITIHPDSCDYSILSQIWAEQTQNRLKPTGVASPELWRLIGLLPPNKSYLSQSHSGCPAPEMQTLIFYMSSETFKALTSLSVAEDTSHHPSAKVTANDMLMALLWRCIIRARATAAGPYSDEYGANSMSLLDTTLDGRALIGDPLPWSYMGTLVLIATTEMSVGDLTRDGTSLATIARAIRESLSNIGRQKALDAFGLASDLHDYGDSLQYPFATFDGAEVCVTSWVGLSAFDSSFGDKLFSGHGRPDLIRPPTREFDAVCRRCVVLPMQVSGGFEVLVSLKTEEMEVLKTDSEYLEYFKVIDH